jgi:hypothetical protein
MGTAVILKDIPINYNILQFKIFWNMNISEKYSYEHQKLQNISRFSNIA